MKKPHKIFFPKKKQRKILLAHGLSIRQLWALGCRKCNASAAVVVAEKMWISQNMLWLPCSSSMSRW